MKKFATEIRSKQQGFTLLELMAAVAVLGILISVGIPSFFSSIRSNRLTTYHNEFVTSLNFARSEAVKRGMSVSMRKLDTDSASGTGAVAGWESGWDVFTDVDSDGRFDTGADELLRTYSPLQTGYTLRGNTNFANFIRFTSRGASNQFGSFFLCDSRDGNTTPEPNTSRLIIVNAVGRARVGKDTNNDGIPNTDSVSSTASNITTCTP